MRDVYMMFKEDKIEPMQETIATEYGNLEKVFKQCTKTDNTSLP